MNHTSTVYGTRLLAISPDLTPRHGFIIDWMAKFRDSQRMEWKEVNGRVYYWVSYKKVLTDIGFYLGLKSADSVRPLFRDLVAVKLLETAPDFNSRKAYYSPGEAWDFYFSDKPVEMNRLQPVELNRLTRLKSTTYPNTNDPSTNSIKEKLIKENPTLDPGQLSELYDFCLKKGLAKQVDQVLVVIQHFKDVAKSKIEMMTYAEQVVNRLKGGATLEDILVLINYKVWYFTHELPKPGNINLGSFMRPRDFALKVAQAKEWAARQTVDIDAEYIEALEPSEYKTSLVWLWDTEELRPTLPTEARWLDFLGFVNKTPALKNHRLEPSKLVRRAVLSMTKEGNYPEGDLVTELISFISKSIKVNGN